MSPVLIPLVRYDLGELVSGWQQHLLHSLQGKCASIAVYVFTGSNNGREIDRTPLQCRGTPGSADLLPLDLRPRSATVLVLQS